MKLKRSKLRIPTLFFQIGVMLLCSRWGAAEEIEQMSEEDLDSTPLSSLPIAPTPMSFGSGTSQIAPFGSLFGAGNPLAVNSLLSWGPVQLKPSLNYSYTTSDGIQVQPGQKTKTTVQSLNANFVFLLGKHWIFTYSPSYSSYSGSQNEKPALIVTTNVIVVGGVTNMVTVTNQGTAVNLQDSFNHSFNLSGSTTYKSWSFNVSQGYVNSFSPLIETAAQTDQESFTTSFTAGRPINSRASISLGVSQNLRFVKSLDSSGGEVGDSRDWSNTDWLNYQLSSKVSSGLGVGFGYSQNGSDMTYEQLNGRIGWAVDQKLNLSLTGGVESRQFMGENLVNPVFSAAITYQVFPTTSLSLSANRSVNNSFFVNQVTENTGVNLGLSQILLRKYSLNLTAGTGTTEYKGQVVGTTAGRKDEFFNYGANLSRAFLQRGSISVFYSKSENSSGQTGFDYSSTQIGFQIGYQF